MAGTRKKKYEAGHAVAFLTQTQALKKMQISLQNFRRLCILKGIYPVEPKHRNRANKGNTEPRVFYYAKDVAFLAREPLLETFRKLRVYQRKLKHYREKNDTEAVFRLRMSRPRYSLHELVKERYPTREDAIRDLSDSLNLIFLFARLPKLPQFSATMIRLSRRLSVEFLNYIVAMRAVRKAFISIKGIYIQADVQGISLVWIMPHVSAAHVPSDVDYRTLSTCLEFDVTLLGSLLCHLYKNTGLVYPPKLGVINNSVDSYCYQNYSPKELDIEYLACLCYPIKKLVNEEEEDEANIDDLEELKQMDDQVGQALAKQSEIQRVKTLFKDKKFFLNREVPREVLTLIIRSCGGLCSWDPLCGPGSTFKEDDHSIDYQVVDRPMKDMKVGRYYVQPQWLFDSLNATRLMPVQDYLPGCDLPAHLSPFALAVSENANPNVGVYQRETALSGSAPGFGAGAALYRPPEADYLAGLVSLAQIRGAPIAAEKEADEDDISEEEVVTASNKRAKKSNLKEPKAKKEVIEMEPGKMETKQQKVYKEQAQENAQRKLQEMGIHKKHKRLYRAMKSSIKEQNKELKALQDRRQKINQKKTRAS